MTDNRASAIDDEKRDNYIKEKCETLYRYDSVNLLPLTPQIPNCYMYTVIYSLSNMPHFINSIVSLNKKQFSFTSESKTPLDSDEDEIKFELFNKNKRQFVVYWFNQCIKYLLNFEDDAYSQDYLNNYNLIKFLLCVREYCPIEEDATAFCEFLFDNLDELYKNELSNVNLCKTKWSTNYKCKNCSHLLKAPDDTWNIWRLAVDNISESDDIIQPFFRPSTLKPFSCENCKSKDGEADIVTEICGELPLNLIIQVDRVSFKDNKLVKSDKYVNFSETITIKNVKYNLKSLVLHFGETPEDGHFVSVVKKRLKTKPDELKTDTLWYILDGLNFKMFPDLNDECFETPDFQFHKQAILLFYTRE